MRTFSLAVLMAALLPTLLGGCASSGPHKEAIRPATGASPLFSPVVRTGNLLFLAGVVGRNPDGDIGAATRQALDTIRDRLGTAGASLSDLVRCMVLLTDMDHYGAMNEVYVTYFPTDPPARTAIAVRALPGNGDVEIECIAAAP